MLVLSPDCNSYANLKGFSDGVEPVQRRELPWHEVRSKLVKKPISLKDMKEWRTREAPTQGGRPALRIYAAPLDFALHVSVRASHATTTALGLRSSAWIVTPNYLSNARSAVALECSEPRQTANRRNYTRLTGF